mgnify:CR=1 FL=1
MSDKKSFGYLGNTFQIQLLNNIILYKDFSNSILEVIDPHYFDNQYFRIICQMIKEYYSKYEHTPTFDTLEQLTKSEISSPMAQKSVLDTLQQVKDVSDEGSIFVQEKSLKFCKQQELQKVITKAQSIIDKGEVDIEEGCLTWPLLFIHIKRPTEIKVRFYKNDGETQIEMVMDGIDARCFLHEYDHLQGTNFIDIVSDFKLRRAMEKRDKRFKKLERRVK